MAESMTSSPIRQPAYRDLEMLLRLPEEEIDRTLRCWPRSRLAAVLRLLGNRLGTPNEQPTDFEIVLRVAHQLNNLLAAERILKELADYEAENPD